MGWFSNLKTQRERAPTRVYAGAAKRAGLFSFGFGGLGAARPGYVAGRVSSEADPGLQDRCARKMAGELEPSVDVVGWVLTRVYGVRDTQANLSKYPKYDRTRARDDLAACAAGKPLPHASSVVRFDKVARTARYGVSLFGTRLGVGSKREDERKYALMSYHGFTRRDVEDDSIMGGIPYTLDMARKDIARARTGREPRYQVLFRGAEIIDKKTGQVYTRTTGGVTSQYKYSPHGPKRGEGRYAGQHRAPRSAGAWTPRPVDFRRDPSGRENPLVAYDGTPWTRGAKFRRVQCADYPDLPRIYPGACRGGKTTEVVRDEYSTWESRLSPPASPSPAGSLRRAPSSPRPASPSPAVSRAGSRAGSLRRMPTSPFAAYAQTPFPSRSPSIRRAPSSRKVSIDKSYAEVLRRAASRGDLPRVAAGLARDHPELAARIARSPSVRADPKAMAAIRAMQRQPSASAPRTPTR